VDVGAPGPGDPTSAAPSAPTSPSAPGAPTSTGPPADPAYVTGDLDGDGLGDVVWGDFERSSVVPSTGRGFGTPVRRPVPSRGGVVGDLDGDGTGDLVEIADDRGGLVVTVHSGGRRALPTALVEVPRTTDELDRDFVAADVNGDGLDDLVVATARGVTDTELTVALSRGDGTFVRSRRWFQGPLDPRQAGWAVGDFDGNGVDDLLHHATVDQDYQVSRAQVVLSTGSAERGFRVVGRPLRVPEELGGTFFGVERLHVGDVDADGEPEVVGLEPYGLDAVVWEWLGDRFDSGRFWTDPDVLGGDTPGGGASYASLADVDGDGRADVVTLGEDGPQVHLSTGRRFRFAPAWRSAARPDDVAELVDRVALGIY
jgi:hypothetical protein